MDSLNEVSVLFTVKNAVEGVHLVGNCESLGTWNPLLGIKLGQLDSSYVTIDPIKFLKGSKIEYKYVTITSDHATWEIIENRKLTPNSNLYVEDTINDPISYLDYCQKRFENMRRNSSEIKFERLCNEISPTIIISMHLPVKLKKEQGCWKVFENNSSWHAQLYDVAKTKLDFTWIGYPGDYEKNDEQEITKILAEYHCVPVFIPKDTLKYHAGFCENRLINILNNIIDIKDPKLHKHGNQQWEGYKMLNILFNETLFNCYNRQIVWVHGIELMLLPSFISRKVKDPINIGFYLHKPFPSSEVFRILPHMTSILNALCCCDTIGFQIFEHASHFIGTCKRILGVESNTCKDGYISLNYFGRNITIFIGHIGIMPEKIRDTINEPGYKEVFNNIQKAYQDKTVVLCIDYVSPLAGLTLKMQAIKNIFTNSKNYQENLLFLQILIPNPDFSSLAEKIVEMSEKLNSEQNKERIQVVIKELTLQERYAYMNISSGLLVTTIREGLCLLPFEYLFIKQYKNSGIVLSEFTGASRALSSPYKVNPFDTTSLEILIIDLLKRPLNILKLEKDLAYIESKTTMVWALNFIAQLKNSVKSTFKYQYVPIGMGDTLRVMAIPKSFNKLDDYLVLSAYRSSSNRVLCFDVETILNYLKENESNFTPSTKIVSLLEELCNDPKNTIVIITGRPRAALDKWFGNIKGLVMAAEYGAYIKINPLNWEFLAQKIDSWKEYSKKIIESHVQRMEGSSLIVNESSIIFNYKESESGFGQWQARDMISNLENSLNSEDCEIVEGSEFVEVRPRDIDKGTTLYKIFQKVHKNKGLIDFVFIVGDDVSDEKMFKMVKLLKKRNCEFLANCGKSFTCTFGVKPSDALYYFLNPDEVLKLMDLLSSSGKTNANSVGSLFSRHSNHRFKTVNINTILPKRVFHDSEDFSGLFSPRF